MDEKRSQQGTPGSKLPEAAPGFCNLNGEQASRGTPLLCRPHSPTNLRNLLGQTMSENAPDPWQHDSCFVWDRCYLKGVLVHDLERYRSALGEDIKQQLSALQETLKHADVF